MQNDENEVNEPKANSTSYSTLDGTVTRSSEVLNTVQEMLEAVQTRD